MIIYPCEKSEFADIADLRLPPGRVAFFVETEIRRYL